MDRLQVDEEHHTILKNLLAQIGKMDAVVDAFLPPQLARDLRERNINAIWVPPVLGDGASDIEIERQLLIGEGLLWESRSEEKVLLTRDVKFCRRLRKKAILVRYRQNPHYFTRSDLASYKKWALTIESNCKNSLF